MTIKKQINILITFIAAIPILCLFFIYLHQYISSTSRYLMKGSEEIKVFNESNLSKKEKKDLFNNLKLLPPSIESCVITNDNQIIFSTIKDLKYDNYIPQNELWHFVKTTSIEYFYQFTAISLNTSKVTLITRIPRSKKAGQKHNTIIRPIMYLVTILVLICILYVFFLSKAIFKSLILIENTTKQIADGDLTSKILPENQKIKLNEITTTLKSLDIMRISLLEEQNRKTKFIMGISHDLRTPISIIKGYLEAISDGVISDPKEFSEALDLVKNKTNQLEDMINSLINFMKLNSSQLRNQLSSGSISAIIKNYAKDMEAASLVFKRTIKNNIDIPDNIIIPLNEQLVIRCFENLFNNALRYTNDFDTIEINSYITDGYLYYEMKDSGIGISENDLKYIFDMFYRGTNSRHEEGMGIGLSVVKNIIEIHSWEISVTSKLNEGTSFIIKIPLTLN